MNSKQISFVLVTCSSEIDLHKHNIVCESHRWRTHCTCHTLGVRSPQSFLPVCVRERVRCCGRRPSGAAGVSPWLLSPPTPNLSVPTLTLRFLSQTRNKYILSALVLGAMVTVWSDGWFFSPFFVCVYVGGRVSYSMF